MYFVIIKQLPRSEKIQGLNGIWTHDLHVTGMMLYQLSYNDIRYNHQNSYFYFLQFRFLPDCSFLDKMLDELLRTLIQILP